MFNEFRKELDDIKLERLKDELSLQIEARTSLAEFAAGL